MEKFRALDRKMQVAIGVIGAVFSCILLVCAFAVVAILIGGDDEDDDVAAQATSTPVAEAASAEPTAIPTEAPVVPTAAPTEPPAAEPLSETEYLSTIESFTGEMGDSLTSFVGLMENPTFDSEWQSSLRDILGIWRANHDEMTAVTPPEGYEEVHEEFTMGTENYTLAADELDTMLETQSQEAVDNAVNFMNLANEHTAEANRLLIERTSGN